MPLYIAQSGDLDRCYRCLTDRLTTLKDRATQLLIEYKSGALVTQSWKPMCKAIRHTCSLSSSAVLFSAVLMVKMDGEVGL